LAIPGRDECVDLVTRNRTPWRALLRQRRGFPRAGTDLVDQNGAGLRPARIGRHGGRPSKVGSASKHGIPSAPSSFRLPLELRKISFPNCGPDGSRSRRIGSPV
jgi:hypothetical protein